MSYPFFRNFIMSDTGTQCNINRSAFSVLYVDDEQDLLEIARIFLEQSGEFRVETMTSAQEALNSLRIPSYDAIVSDYQMPGMDGIDFLKAVREQFGDIPFILFTGRGREEVVIDAINNGADFYLQKGGDPQAQFAELAQKIRQAVRRKQAECSLYDSEKRFSDIINFIPDATFAIDQSGKVIAWNRAIEEMTGVTSGDMLGKGEYEYAIPFYGSRRPILIDLINEPDEQIVQFYSNSNRTGNSLVIETDFSHPKGNRIFIVAKACPLFNQAGEITGAIESIRDITELKRIEQALRRSEERYRSVVNDQTDMITRFTPDGTITFANEAYQLYFMPMLGPDEIEGKNIHEIMQIANYTVIDNVLSSLTVQTPIREIEQVITGNDGEKYWHLCSVRALFENAGTASECQMVCRDITEQKRTEEALQKQRDFTDAVLDSIPGLLYVYDDDGHLVQWNRNHEIITGYSGEELAGMHVLDWYKDDPHDTAIIREAVERTIREGYGEAEANLTIKDGRKIPFYFTAVKLDVEGRKYFTGIGIDITSRKHAEKAIRDSEEKFRVLVEYSLDGIAIIDNKGNILFVNRAAGRIIDVKDSGTLIGKRNLLEFVDPQSRADMIRDIGLIAQGIDVCLVQYKLNTEAKREIWVECTGKKIPFMQSEALFISMRDFTERKRAEEVLRESENRLATIFLNSPVALTVVSAVDGTFIDVNEAFLRNTGYAREDLIGKTSDELGIFAVADEYERIVSSLQNQRSIQNMEITCRIKTGENRICQFSSSLIMIGREPHILSTIEDITERKTTESAFQALVRSMIGTTGIDSLQKITENVSSWLGADCVMVGEIQPDTKTVKVLSMLLDGQEISDFAYTLTGTPCENVTEKGFCQYPDNAAQLFPESKDLKDLNIRGYIGTPLQNSTGKVFGVLCALFRNPIHPPPSVQEIMDIIAVKAASEIERTQIERAFKKSKQMLSEAMDMAHLVNWEYDIRTDVFTFDDHFYALYGTTAENEGGHQMTAETYAREFLHPGDRDMVAREIEKAIKTTDPQFTSQCEHRIIRKNGEIRHIVVRFGITKDSKGETIKTHGANQDITERKKTEEALRMANRKLNLLSSITRHDILNNVSAILLYLDIAELKFKDPNLLEYIRNIGAATAAIQSQIEFTRVYEDLGIHEPQWQVLDAIMPHSHIPAHITLKANLQDVSIFADPMLEKVFFNLLDNSIRHGQKVTNISVSTHQSDDVLTVVWEDNGIGIAAEEKEQIFERGFGKNTGLGMFLVRDILSLTDITIKENGIFGKGARFEITVPRGTFRIA